jgi:DNA-binding XRE family transcriptional regulator
MINIVVKGKYDPRRPPAFKIAAPFQSAIEEIFFSMRENRHEEETAGSTYYPAPIRQSPSAMK